MIKAGLYIISTPIGNLQDITFRAIDTLKSCQIIFCEDTRVTRILCDHYGIKVPLSCYHDHNADRIRPVVIDRIKQGQTIALVSDAGTPLISDPGYKLVKQCYAEGIFVTVIPGASSLIAGLCLSGLPTYPFSFVGFVNAAKDIMPYQKLSHTLVAFLANNKIMSVVKGLKESMPFHQCALVKEVTKVHEQVLGWTYDDILETLEKDPSKMKGEFVLFLYPSDKVTYVQDEAWKALLHKLLLKMTVRDAVETVVETFGVKKKLVYEYAIYVQSSN